MESYGGNKIKKMLDDLSFRSIESLHHRKKGRAEQIVWTIIDVLEAKTLIQAYGGS